MLARHPALTAITVVALAFGIGFTAIVFSVVNTVLLRGLPFPDSDRVMAVKLPASESEAAAAGVPLRDYLGWREQLQGFEELAAYREGSVNLAGPEGPVRYGGAWVTANTFAALRVGPAAGRPFREDGASQDAPPEVILSHRLWVDVFGGSPGAIGDTITVRGEAAQVVGVMPEGFLFPWRHDMWMPLRTSPPDERDDFAEALTVFGRVAPGVSADAASAELAGVLEDQGRTPGSVSAAVAEVVPFTRAPITPGAVSVLWATLGVAALVLMTACANAANVLLVRAVARMRETGIRTAMGAQPSSVVHGTMQEAAVLSLLGALFGTGIAWVGIGLFDRATAVMLPPFWIVLDLDLAVFLFIVAVAALATLLSGGPTACKLARADTAVFLRNDHGGVLRLRIGRLSRWMAAGGLAMSMGLLVAAGLMTRSLATLASFDYGFDHTNVFAARMSLAQADFRGISDRQRFFAAVAGRVAALPGVEYAAIGTSLPGLNSPSVEITIEGESRAEGGSHSAAHAVTARSVQVTPGYFDVFGVPILRGRDFGPGDTADGPSIAIVNRSFAAAHLGGDALGKRLRMGTSDSDGPWATVIGIVPDLYVRGLANTGTGPAGVYTPLAQGDALSAHVIALGPDDPVSLTPGVREAVIAAGPNTPIYQAGGMSGVLVRETQFFRTSGYLLVIVGIAALFVAAVGLYGVVSFAAAQRRRELGVRILLGARRPDIFRLVLRLGMLPMCSGLAMGTALATLIAWELRFALFEVSPFDPWSFGVAALLLLGAGLLAMSIPALLATRIDPVEALRAK